MDPEDASPDVLSQAEVERLLAEVAEQEGSALVLKSGGRKERQNHEAIQPYDFRHPVFLSASELRKLRLRHEDIIRSLAARLSIYLRLEFGLQMAKLQTIVYQRFVESLSNPSHITLFKVEPLRGICILEINPRLGLTIVDRLMGGPAHSVTANRDLTDIEVALLDQAVEVILGEWSGHWAGMQELRPSILGHENSGRFLQTAPHDTVMLALTLEARLGDCMEQIQIGFPYYTLEPLIRRLGAELSSDDRLSDPAGGAPMKWSQVFGEVNIPIVAEWPDFEITARQLSELKVGDVLQLGPACVNQVMVRFAKVPKYLARLGTQSDHWAVELGPPAKK